MAAGSTFGGLFRLTTFGESHGVAIGGVIDGCPSGLKLDTLQIQKQLDKRKPGVSPLTSGRREEDKLELLSGIFEGVTTGAPIGFVIRNKDAREEDYSHLKDKFRPSHADYTYSMKYGFRDHRGGGRASARETACRVVGGEIARQLLHCWGVHIWAYTSQIGDVQLKKSHTDLQKEKVYASDVRCPDPLIADAMISLIKKVRKAGDSIGGTVTCIASGVPAGMGEPVYEKLHAVIGSAMLGINAARGIEFGAGFASAGMRGSEHNDLFCLKEGKIATETNHSGGIQGGISNGEDICFRVAFKPAPSIMKQQQTVNTKGEICMLKGRGRHDPCVAPRAVPVVEAMTALVLADHFLKQRATQLEPRF